MPRFFSNKRLILLLVGVIVLVALISFSLKDRQNASLPEQIVKDVVGFGQSLILEAGALHNRCHWEYRWDFEYI